MAKSMLALLRGKKRAPVTPPPFPRFTRRAVKRVVELLERGRTVVLGRHAPEMKEVEAALSRYHGGRQALAVGSGTAALHVALIGLEIGPGDEVITTPFTWGATVACIMHQNAIPRFADVDPETGLLDPQSVEAAVTRRTAAVLPVHIFGQPADMTAFGRLGRRHGLAIIEDGSQAHGASHRGQVVGNFGDAAGFSCMGGKLLATLEAGYMVTPHEKVFWKACLSSQHMGRSGDPDFPPALRPYVDSLVYSFRISSVAAVLMTEQLKKLGQEVRARQENVRLLREFLADCWLVRFPRYPKGDLPSYHMLTMNFQADRAGVSRATFIKALRAEGVAMSSYVPSPIPAWRRMNWQGYRGPKVMWMESLRRAGVDYRKVRLPNCERKIAQSLEMGFNFTRVSRPTMQRMADAFYRIQEGIGELRAWERRQPASPGRPASAG